MAWSAIEHWAGSEELRSHYAESILGERGITAVAAAQTVAALGLLWIPTQRMAGWVLAIIMLVATTTHIRDLRLDPSGWVPIGIGLWALIPTIGLTGRWRRRGAEESETARPESGSKKDR